MRTSGETGSELRSDADHSHRDATQILIVDDEHQIRSMLARVLEGHSYACTVASNTKEARKCLEREAFALILCDVNMPGESGLHLVNHVMREYPETAMVMITGVDDPNIANLALQGGAYGYILKPFESNEILINVGNALRRRRLEIENRVHRERLELTVMERTASLRLAIERLARAEQEIRLSREETIQRLALAAEFRDEATAKHVQRMSRYCALLARKVGMDEDRCELIRVASPMHDIGKIGTPDHLLLKPDKFTPQEFEAITRHTEMGYRILAGSEAELLKLAAIIAWTHHEKFDGTGYPRTLAGEAIPLEGRIAAIADVFDALTNKRVYKPAYSVERSIEMMRGGRGKHFDPSLLDTFLDSMDEVLAIKAQFAEL